MPEHATLLARFVGESSPVKSTVTKAVAEFRRTHADTWSVQKDSFTEEQLEVNNIIIIIIIIFFESFPRKSIEISRLYYNNHGEKNLQVLADTSSSSSYFA